MSKYHVVDLWGYGVQIVEIGVWSNLICHDDESCEQHCGIGVEPGRGNFVENLRRVIWVCTRGLI